MRMARRHEDFIQCGGHGIEIAVDLHAQDLGPFGPIDRQHSVRRDFLDVFGIVEIIAEGLDAAFLDFLSLGFFLILLFQPGPFAIPGSTRGCRGQRWFPSDNGHCLRDWRCLANRRCFRGWQCLRGEGRIAWRCTGGMIGGRQHGSGWFRSNCFRFDFLGKHFFPGNHFSLN